MEKYLICISFCLISGLMMSRIAKKFALPAVTAYLVTGLLLGPFCIGNLNITGIGFSTFERVKELDILSQTALGFIAFAIGNEFRLSQLKTMGKQAITIGILQAVLTSFVVDVVLIGLHLTNPQIISLPAAIILGAIASATAPAATLMVVKQYKAEGPLTKLLLLVVAIDDAVGLILFSASFGVAKAIEYGSFSITAIVLEPILEIILSLLLGSLIGYALYLIEKFFHSKSKRLSISVAFVMLAVGASMLKFEIGSIKFGFSLLLVCMMTGTVFCNICDFSEELMGRVDTWTSPLNVLFFVISGAELDLNIFKNPTMLMIGIIFIISRTLGKCYGSNISCHMSKCSKNVTKYLGITLLPQAGVALGMAHTASILGDGATIRNVVLFSVLVYELIGPVLTKFALTKAGEINPEGKTNARNAANANA